MLINVAIIEADERVLSRLTAQINATAGLHCLGQYASAANAMNDFSARLPEVVLIEINLPGNNGCEWVRRLKAAYPKLLILVVTHSENTQMIFSALAAGAVGYLLKRSSPEQITAAIQEAYHGGSPMTGCIARRMVGLFQLTPVPGRELKPLSQREQQVMDYLAKGFSYQKIADEIGVRYATVHTHIRHIYKKFQVNTRTDAVTSYLRQVARYPWPIDDRLKS